MDDKELSERFTEIDRKMGALDLKIIDGLDRINGRIDTIERMRRKGATDDDTNSIIGSLVLLALKHGATEAELGAIFRNQ